ncbi:MAG TPA: hypothetical protein VGF86_01840 [Candidatus Tumulicola sp.]
MLLARAVAAGPLLAYAGCGCGGGPSARSLPAAAATWLVFGPGIAIARWLAAIGVALLLARRRRGLDGCRACVAFASLLNELSALLPAAVGAGIAVTLTALTDPRVLPAPALAAGGMLLGFAGAPCALGAVALAVALHARAPLAAGAFLCVAGIVDARALARRPATAAGGHDAFAYGLLAIGLGIVAARHGGALVHPVMTAALALAAAVALFLGVRHRRRRDPRVRFAPAIMLLGAVLATPPPPYRATETTMTDLFPPSG